MEGEKSIDEQMMSSEAPTVATTSCPKKKNEEASFLENVKDHVDEFIHASMDEHKTCFQKTIKKMFGMSKAVAERNSKTKGVESSLPLQTKHLLGGTTSSFIFSYKHRSNNNDNDRWWWWLIPYGWTINITVIVLMCACVPLPRT